LLQVACSSTIHRSAGTKEERLTIRLRSSEEHPLVNPALVIDPWSAHARVRVSVNGKEAGARPRLGVERHLEGDGLVLYLEMTASGLTEIVIEPTSAER
jgi:hypothetical protein